LVQSYVTAYIGLGANLGDARAAIVQALKDFAGIAGVALVRQSSLYASAPVDSSGPDYVNAVAEVSTRLSAMELLLALQTLEQDAGRQRPYRNAPRTLDLDLLLYGNLTVKDPTLTVPHPRMFERAFVLVPLAEIAPHCVSAKQLAGVQEQGVRLLS
jgi:2-amino-4-hydroxy-6-hydroxymethyldihydropteridine diphosphokinase